MTVGTDVVKEGLTGDGSSLIFHYTIPFIDKTFLKLYKLTGSVETLLILGTDYTIEVTAPNLETVTILLGNQSHFIAAPTLNDQIWLIRVSPKTQTGYDLIASSPWLPLQTEEALDKLELQIQEVNEAVNRSVKTGPFTPPSASLIFPTPVTNKYIKWNQAATALENSTKDVDGYDARITQVTTDLTNLTAEVATIQTRLNDINATLSSIQTQINTIKSENVVRDSTITSQGNRITVLEGKVNGLTDQSADIALLKSDVAILKADMAAVKSEQITQNNRLDNLTNRVIYLEDNFVNYRRTGKYPIHNNQTIFLDTNMVFDADYTVASRLYMYVYRKDNLELRVATYVWTLHYYKDHWNMSLESKTVMEGGDDGMYFALRQSPADKAAFVQYISNNMAGIYDETNSIIRWETDDFLNM
jgi:outer membrane murein-binding lipoprotein Lpp